MNIDLGLLPLAKRTARDPTAIGLLAGNLVATAIAVLNPPITMSLMFLFWAECAVIGVFNLIKMFYVMPAGCDERDRKKMTSREWLGNKLFGAGLFVVFYSGFLVFCWGAIRNITEWELRRNPGMQNFAAEGYYGVFLLPVAVLALGHGISFYVNFLGKREYIGRDFENQMWRPFLRVGPTTVVTFLLLTPLIMLTRSPGAVVGIFVVIKLYADLFAHFRDHDTAEAAAAAAAIALRRRK